MVRSRDGHEAPTLDDLILPPATRARFEREAAVPEDEVNAGVSALRQFDHNFLLDLGVKVRRGYLCEEELDLLVRRVLAAVAEHREALDPPTHERPSP